MSEQNAAAVPAHDQPATNPETPHLSKSAMKKAAKTERLQAAKLERRAREKEARKAKKKVLAEKRAAGELDEEDEERKRGAKRRKVQFGGRVVVDLGFDNLMSDKEVKSLCSQLAYTYSANRQANFPFSLLFTSLNGNTYQRLESLGDASYKRWANSEWWTEGFERLWSNSMPSGPSSEATDAAPESDLAPSDGADTINPEKQSSTDDGRQKVVYLTADCEEELTELKPDETYIIGGICDHNRYKNLCLNKAKEHGVRTAKFPIGRYLSNLPTRKVLTVNQCFEILLKWVETKDWEEALYSVVPKRKFQSGEKGHDPNVVAESVEQTGEDEQGEDASNVATVSEQPSEVVEAKDDNHRKSQTEST